MRNTNKGKKDKGNQLRIIGGQWRSRRLPIADVPGLRPTPDRVRETLFNWLQWQVPGARCLDLFAGSGALGLEALSREAAEVVFVEKNSLAYRQLQANITTLACSKAKLHAADALVWLKQQREPFDLVFLDPPFRLGLPDQALALLLERQLLKPGGMIYLEHENGYSPDLERWGLVIHRQTTAGQVVSSLLKASAD